MSRRHACRDAVTPLTLTEWQLRVWGGGGEGDSQITCAAGNPSRLGCVQRFLDCIKIRRTLGKITIFLCRQPMRAQLSSASTPILPHITLFSTQLLSHFFQRKLDLALLTSS